MKITIVAGLPAEWDMYINSGQLDAALRPVIELILNTKQLLKSF